MVEVRYSGKGPTERLNDRLKNSGGDLPAEVKTKHGDGARRVFHNVHESGSQGGANRLGRNADGSDGDKR